MLRVWAPSVCERAHQPPRIYGRCKPLGHRLSVRHLAPCTVPYHVVRPLAKNTRLKVESSTHLPHKRANSKKRKRGRLEIRKLEPRELSAVYSLPRHTLSAKTYTVKKLSRFPRRFAVLPSLRFLECSKTGDTAYRCGRFLHNLLDAPLRVTCHPGAPTPKGAVQAPTPGHSSPRYSKQDKFW